MTEFLSLYAYSRTYNTPGWLVEASVLFSWGWHYSLSLWFRPWWQTPAGMPSVLATCLPELWLLPLGLLTGNQPQIKGRCFLPYTCLPVVGISTLWVCVAPLTCFLLSVMEPPQQGSECCGRERSLFSSIPKSWGSQTFTHWLCFPFRRSYALFPLGVV